MGGSLSDAFKATLIAGASIVLSAGIGGLFNQGVMEALGGFAEVAKAAAHGIKAGGLTELAGGDFGSGFLSGFAGEFGNNWIDANMEFGVGAVVASAVVGGTASELGGGKFMNGAVHNAFALVFNHHAGEHEAQGGQSGGAGSSSSGSRLGNALRNIPIAGFVLGSVGDIVSGQIGHGVSSFVNTLTADIGATAVGVFGKVYVTGRDLYRMGGSLLSGDLKGFGGNFAKFAHDLIIPTYGWYGGAGWGAEQDGIWGLRNPFNAVDANSQIHDGSNGNHLGWVVNNWRELGTVGPVASAYTILGTIPFTAGDFITDDGKP